MSVRQLTRIALLAALCVVLRYAFAGLPNIKPISALYFLLVDAEDLKSSLLVMSISIFVSSFLLGMGPWVLFQIVTFAAVICLWYLLYRHFRLFGQSVLAMLLAFGYGILIDSIMAALYQMPWWTYVAAGAGFNLAHALSTLLFYPILYPILRRLYHEKTF
ncbi:ECF transporter S component [Streptococcus panodentis]|uniref:ECF transporter S component n=1 Tax=Streptococcus panodentis TaxID=1581472 RepID=A0ABS5AW54_9STRE|nr:ECF transporter S component [Streptococcus sp. DD11]KXT85180.1 Substrate-specific component CbrT of putative cobalamin ECF transporter [Streptococcus sp. DD11]MBP2620715.1 ECF transporter S component [Streptococcus panodentis]